MSATRLDPYNGYNFSVELDGLTRAGFKTCSGLDTTIAVTPYREGTEKVLNQRALPGLVTFSNITLTRGITMDRALFDWHDQIVQGTPIANVRKSISIMLLDNQTNVKIRWDLINAWPSKWSGPSFDAGSEAIGIETLEIAHEGCSVSQWS
jgi:phage tail-like protein